MSGAAGRFSGTQGAPRSFDHVTRDECVPRSTSWLLPDPFSHQGYYRLFPRIWRTLFHQRSIESPQKGPGWYSTLLFIRFRIPGTLCPLTAAEKIDIGHDEKRMRYMHCAMHAYHQSVALQVLMEMGRPFDSVQAATAATTLRAAWPDAWVTLARCQVCSSSCTVVPSQFPAPLL